MIQGNRNFVGNIKQACDMFRIDSLALSEMLQQDNVINVALAGGFKAGKSSFVNSLIGKDVMPVAVLPLTSVITCVKYGAEDRSKVKLLSGKEQDIALSELPEYITEERNPENKTCPGKWKKTCTGWPRSGITPSRI